MRYEGPIYRPPSEADSLLIQATIGCPHNRCTFCMVYKNGPRYRVRPVHDVKEDMADYGSSQFVHKKGPRGLEQLARAGLGRIHVGLESGDDGILKRICKGTDSEQHIEAERWTMAAGIELSLYVILGIGGYDRTREHAERTARVINEIAPDVVRLRTFVPKINTPLLTDVMEGRFRILTPHKVLKEAASLLEGLTVSTMLTSDHYTNYINLCGRLPHDKPRLLDEIRQGLERDESEFRPFFVGAESMSLT